MSHAHRLDPTHTHTHTACSPGGEHGQSSSEFGDKEGSIEKGRGRYEPFHHVFPEPTFDPLLSFFHTDFSTRLFLRFDTRLRPQTPTPSETAELRTNLTAWSDVSRSRITSYYEPHHTQRFPPCTHTHTFSHLSAPCATHPWSSSQPGPAPVFTFSFHFHIF